MTKYLVKYKLWKNSNKKFITLFIRTQVREKTRTRIQKFGVYYILPQAPIYTTPSMAKGLGTFNTIITMVFMSIILPH